MITVPADTYNIKTQIDLGTGISGNRFFLIHTFLSSVLTSENAYPLHAFSFCPDEFSVNQMLLVCILQKIFIRVSIQDPPAGFSPRVRVSDTPV